MIKQHALWILTLSIVGCNSMKNIAGTYSSDNDLMVNHILQIEKDGNFRYYSKGDLLDVSGNGTWHLSAQGDLVLKSDQTLRPGVIDFVEDRNPSKVGFNIKVLDENGKPLSHAAVTLNGNSKHGFNVDENGLGRYKTSALKSLSINFLGEEYRYVLNNPNSNYIVLTIRLQSASIMYFDNEIWEVKRKKLIGRDNLILKKEKKD